MQQAQLLNTFELVEARDDNMSWLRGSKRCGEIAPQTRGLMPR